MGKFVLKSLAITILQALIFAHLVGVIFQESNVVPIEFKIRKFHESHIATYIRGIKFEFTTIRSVFNIFHLMS